MEANTETAADLRYLLGRATSLGGLRPKCTVIDRNGRLAISKFPSIDDERDVARGEVLALLLARRAGLNAAVARVEALPGGAVAVIERFDRLGDDLRIPYISASSLLDAGRDEERSYLDLVDAMRRHGRDAAADARELWRRLVFNLLITNVDDHLHNLGFLHVADGQWRLAPAFDLNPFPDKARESKTWLSDADGPVTSVAQLLDAAGHFSLRLEEARAVLAQVVSAAAGWRKLATGKAVGMSASEAGRFAPAFEHSEMDRAQAASMV